MACCLDSPWWSKIKGTRGGRNSGGIGLWCLKWAGTGFWLANLNTVWGLTKCGDETPVNVDKRDDWNNKAMGENV